MSTSAPEPEETDMRRLNSTGVVCCLLFVVCCCLLFVGCWLLVVGCWLLVVCCVLCVVCCVLCVVCCVLCVVCCVLCVCQLDSWTCEASCQIHPSRIGSTPWQRAGTSTTVALMSHTVFFHLVGCIDVKLF